MTVVLTKKDVESVLTMKDAIDAVEIAFQEMGEGRIEMPARIYLHFDKYKGFLTCMPAYIREMNVAGFKSAGLWLDNPRYNLPRVIGQVTLIDPRTGILLALMDGVSITAIRTGAAGAVSAKYLARKDATVAGIIGTGVQGRSQLRGLCEVREIEKVKVYDTIQAASREYAKEMTEELGIDVEVVNSVEKTVRGVEILVTCTPSTEPFVKGDFIAEGMHITAVGADAGNKRELESSVYEKVDKLVLDFIEQGKKVGEIGVPISEGVLKREDIYGEICEIVAGKKPGRETDTEITIAKLTGLAIQDVATAYKVYQTVKEKRIGREIEI